MIIRPECDFSTRRDRSRVIAFFGVGLVAMSDPSRVLRAVQKIRDRRYFYGEFHFARVTSGTAGHYREIIDVCLDSDDLRFYCFVAERTVADSVARFGDTWTAYSKMAEQLIVANMKSPEIVTVLADNYSTPDHILFEQEVRQGINRRLRRLAVSSVVRLDSRSTDGLQIVDLPTSAAAFEFRENAGLAARGNDKAKLAAYVREKFGAESFLTGWSDESNSVRLTITASGLRIRRRR